MLITLDLFAKKEEIEVNLDLYGTHFRKSS